MRESDGEVQGAQYSAIRLRIFLPHPESWTRETKLIRTGGLLRCEGAHGLWIRLSGLRQAYTRLESTQCCDGVGAEDAIDSLGGKAPKCEIELRSTDVEIGQGAGVEESIGSFQLLVVVVKFVVRAVVAVGERGPILCLQVAG